MDNLKISESSISSEIQELTDLCAKKAKEYGEKSSWFKPAMTEASVRKWESENNIVLPDTYREWLLFSEEALIRNNLAHFYRPDDYKYDEISGHSELIIVGEVYSDGEILCLSKVKNTFCVIDHGEIEEVKDFRDVLKELIRILSEKSALSPKMQDLLMQMVKDKR